MKKLALVLALIAASTARAQDTSSEKPAKEAFAAIAKGLILEAASDAGTASDLAGAALPPDLRRDFEGIHAAGRAKDVREAKSQKLKNALLKTLIDESPEAQDVQRRFADLAGKLASELDDLVSRSALARTDALQLLKDASAGKYVSPSAVAAGKAGPMGPLLLRLAKAAPFLRGEVRAEGSYDARYRVLERAYERAPDGQAAFVLSVLARIESKGKGPLEAVGGDGAVKAFASLVRMRLDAARDATVEAMSAAKDAARNLRQGELSKAVSGLRSADLEFGVRLLAAYKKQFNATPALDATEVAGVYFDRNSNRAYFYVEGEDRWVEGAAHAASLMPVTVFLLQADDPQLQRRATDPRALAALYHAFGEKVPFESGLAEAQRTAQAVSARARALVAIATKGGATPEQLDRFFAETAGYDRDLAGPIPGLDDSQCAKRAMERLARAVIENGAPAAAAIAEELAAALAALQKVQILAFSGIKVEAPVPEVALSLRADMLSTPPLVAPPRTLVAGGSARCVLVVREGESAAGAALEGEGANAAGEPFSGRLELDVAAAAATGHVEGRTLAVKPGATLAVSGPRGNKVRAGEKILARLSPSRPARLKLLGPSKEDETGPWTAEGGVVAPCALWSSGTWTATAVDESSRPIAQASFEVESAAGLVCVDAAGSRVVHARLGTKVDVLFAENGKPVGSGRATVALEHASGGIAWAPKEPVSAPKASLELPSDLPPGRYRLVAQIGSARFAPWPLALVKDEPRVSLVRDPFAVDPPPSIGAGERCYARIEPGFALEPGEVASATVQLESLGRKTAARARATPVPGFPVTGLLLPLALKDSIPPGSWDLLADIYVGFGRIRARGKAVIDPSAELPFTLRPADGGEPRELYARGDRAVVKMSDAAAIATASFVLVGPDGLGAPLEPDDNGAFSIAVPQNAPTGSWELRGASRQDGSVLQKAVAFKVYAPARFSVNVRGRVGEQGLVDVPIPEGYVEPVRVRVGSVWTEGNKAIVIPIEGAPSVLLVLEDKTGRRAEGEAVIEIVAETRPDTGTGSRPAGGPRFAIVANLREKTFFFPSYESISRMLREARVPKEWVVVEPGPLSAGEARDHVFSKVPYDGPRASNPLSVYRSQRYWKSLAPSVQALFAQGGCDESTVFDVQNTPITDDEKTTIEMLARRIVETKGGWAYELEGVRVRGAGALAAEPNPDRPKDVSFTATNANLEGGGATRLVVPGPLGDLAVRADLPPRLVLGQPFALAASVAAVPTAVGAGTTYPGGFEKLAARALLGVSLSGSLDVEGKSIAVTASTSYGARAAGRELVFSAVPVRTEKLEDGSARIAEVEAFAGAPPGKPERLELRLEPVPPGVLANKPVRIAVRFKARLTVAVPAADLPPELKPPEGTALDVGGTSYAPDAVDAQLPRPELELEAVYVRQSPEGAPPRANKAALGPSLLVGDKPQALAEIDAAAELKAAQAALAASSFEEAEEHARRALHADPSSSEAWAAVGAALEKRGHPLDAAAPLARAAALRDRK